MEIFLKISDIYLNLKEFKIKLTKRKYVLNIIFV